MKNILKVFVVIALLVPTMEARSQFYPYNPYGNAGYMLGQQIGNTIKRNSKYGRNQLRKAIKKWGECHNGSLSLEHGAVAVYGRNGYFCSAAVDDRISSKLKSINSSNGNITDINILENGQFIIVYDGGKDWYGVLPTALKSALNEYAYDTEFRSISFNESGIYAITTSYGFQSNNSVYQSFYDDNVNEFGELLSVNICGDGAVFCYSDKARFCGRIPRDVETAIKTFSSTAKFVKYNKHGDYLICSKYGSYTYSIGDADEGGNAPTIYYDYAKERKVLAKEKAYAKWDGKAYYNFDENKKRHRVWCTVDFIDGKVITLETSIGADYNAAPTLNVDLNAVHDTDYDSLLKNIPEGGSHNMSMKIMLSNGEIINTNDMTIFKTILGIRLSTSLVSMRSDKRSLRGDLPSIRYLVDQLSSFNIKTITFKDLYTIDFSKIDSKSQLCYDFNRLSKESGNYRILP